MCRGSIDLPLIGRLFARNRKESTQTDIILTLTPHIVRTLDVTEADLRPFRMGRSGGTGGAVTPVERPGIQQPPRDPGRHHAWWNDSTGADGYTVPPAATADPARHNRACDATEEAWRRSAALTGSRIRD